MDIKNLNLKKAASSHANESIFQIIVDTPKGSRNKYEYDEELKLFKLGGVLTAGAVFPFDFGFLPQTLGEDRDPLDALILMDEPAFVGCLVDVRVIGVIEAEQSEAGETFRNDRLLGVAIESHRFAEVFELSELDKNLVKQIEQFFIFYNAAKGKEFKVLRRSGSKRARKLIETGIKNYQSKS
jgi:inorganic pyrophosphatase